MKVILMGTVEDVNSYEGKNGFGANISMSSVENKRRQMVEFQTKNEDVARDFEDALQEECTVEISLTQNKFGLRFGEVISFARSN